MKNIWIVAATLCVVSKAAAEDMPYVDGPYQPSWCIRKAETLIIP